MTRNYFCLFFLLFAVLAEASSSPAYARLQNDTLYIGNNYIERIFIWNGGNLITAGLKDKASGREWASIADKPDFVIPKQTTMATDGKWDIQQVTLPNSPKHTQVKVEYSLGGLSIKKIYRIYDDSPALACDIYLKGKPDAQWEVQEPTLTQMNHAGYWNTLKNKNDLPILDRLAFPGKHWDITAVEFFDATDNNNTLASSFSGLSYQEKSYRGNLIFFEDKQSDKGLFVLKESPCSGMQLAYPGADFITRFGNLETIGFGIHAGDIDSEKWTRIYSTVVGVYNGNEVNRYIALRKYQKNIRTLNPDKDEMVMMNTWGDRGQDKNINENFCLKELEACSRLGITHFQIDDGWQTGRSPASVEGGSFLGIWDTNNYWKPDPKRFPNGLTPVVKKGKELGVEVCLWFNPSFENDYSNWKKDIEALIYLYKEYGIRTFKIDGLAIPNKLSEIRIKELFDKVQEATGYDAVFNIDVTAGRRGGYFFLNEYGNIFLENRYTDWGNYYPFWTLRNLWMLSKYVPLERLQAEFLNKWRNEEHYKNDIFAPSGYSFEYLFGITLAAQPLAWFEGSNLPAEAFKIKEAVEQYKKVSYDFHQGIILPIGDEPSGTSWTGFQSIKGNHEGYILVYRENNEASGIKMATYVPSGSKVTLHPVLGDGVATKQTVREDGKIVLKIAQKNSYALYKYELK
ncbi:MAG TPA: alpha-galactosidase [Porphyromonadaceae bacterium]|jgi:hypothetical protein|nr:alpha-galactosidase [Porphyromonadaceae bacterium]HBK31488.1 alpha-galactosidase [Porphyromonadaceae bacterium]HBL33887.1 alpha-galactosidase [Porphyromonadaceae bacterium]HCM20565.1 alpha-galactosidase [Porphyromonadaceae bacterium]